MAQSSLNMKTLFVFFIFFILNCNAMAKDRLSGSMAILTDGISDAKQKDSSIVFNILTTKIVDTENIKGKIFYYDNEEEIVKKFVNHDIDYIMMNTLFYLKNQTILDKNTFSYWSVRHYKQKYQKMLIIVKKKSHINSIDDLKNKIVIIKEDNYFAKIVLNKALYESKHLSSKAYIRKFIYAPRHSTAILKTYFGKSDAVIVPAAAFDIVCEMNPKVEKSLKVIYETDRIFMPVMSLINKNASRVLVAKLTKLLQNINTNKNGQSMFSFFKVQGIDIVEQKELQNLKTYYREYLDLEQKYGDKHNENR